MELEHPAVFAALAIVANGGTWGQKWLAFARDLRRYRNGY